MFWKVQKEQRQVTRKIASKFQSLKDVRSHDCKYASCEVQVSGNAFSAVNSHVYKHVVDLWLQKFNLFFNESYLKKV